MAVEVQIWAVPLSEVLSVLEVEISKPDGLFLLSMEKPCRLSTGFEPQTKESKL